MNIVSFLDNTRGLRSVDLTVSAQAITPDDNGALRYPVFFPIQNVNSVKLRDITVGNYRPTASRREWNGPGRLIPLQAPATKDLSIIPVESYFTIGEEEMQSLIEQTDNEEALILRRIGADLPSRTDGLAMADYRTIEQDAFHIWAKNEIVQVDPTTGKTYTTSFGIDAARYQDLNVAWTNSTAYANYVAWAKDADATVAGGMAGSVLSRAMLALIMEDAPAGANGYLPMRRDVEARIADEIGREHRFVTIDNTIDTFTDGGTATTPTRIWDADVIAAIPVGGRVGITAKAPVVRAAELAREFGNAGIDRNGVTIFYTPLNEGKGAKVSAQINALPIPDESRVFVVDAGA